MSGLHLTKASKGYLNVALERLAEDYDNDGNDKHAEQVRQLRAYIEKEPVTRTGMPADQQAELQKAVMEAAESCDVQATNDAQRLLWETICRYEPDPAAYFTQQMIAILNQAGKQTAHVTIFMIHKKLELLTKRCEGPNEVFEELNAFLAEGLNSIQRGDTEPIWSQDPDMLGLIEEGGPG